MSALNPSDDIRPPARRCNGRESAEASWHGILSVSIVSPLGGKILPNKKQQFVRYQGESVAREGSKRTLNRVGRAGRIRELLNRYEGPLLRYAVHITGDLDCARDVVQDTFLRLCRQPVEIRDRAAPWLFRVCRNRALDIRRKENRMALIQEVSRTEPPSSEPDPFQRLETAGNVERDFERFVGFAPKSAGSHPVEVSKWPELPRNQRGDKAVGE